MRYTLTTQTITIETTEKGEALTRETVQALTERKTEAWQTVERLALAAPIEAVAETETPIDTTPDPLEDLSYTDVLPEVLAAEAQWDLATMIPANILPAE